MAVLLPYEITLFSNGYDANTGLDKFYYLMKLHYSQTLEFDASYSYMFYYLMKLHYSQTSDCNRPTRLRFYYLMKLHYSQTTYVLIVLV